MKKSRLTLGNILKALCAKIDMGTKNKPKEPPNVCVRLGFLGPFKVLYERDSYVAADRVLRRLSTMISEQTIRQSV